MAHEIETRAEPVVIGLDDKPYVKGEKEFLHTVEGKRILDAIPWLKTAAAEKKNTRSLEVFPGHDEKET